MGRFDDFNKAINAAAIKDIAANNGTGEYKEVPKGEYIVKLVKMEVTACGSNAKTPGAPLLKADFKITDGDYNNYHLFMNKVLYTDRTDDKWNINKLLGGVVGWLASLEPSEDIDVVFEDFDQFEDLILDIAEDVASVEYKVKYDPDGFYNISIEDVYE